MQKAGVLAFWITGSSTQKSGVKHPSRQSKFVEKRVEAVHLRLTGISAILYVTLRIILSPERPSGAKALPEIGEDYVSNCSRHFSKRRDQSRGHTFAAESEPGKVPNFFATLAN